MATPPPAASWKNRIVGFDPAVDAEQLLANPANWRIHPRAQRQALEAVLDQVGFVAPAIVNVTTGHLVDGHMRAESAISKGGTIPVAYVELTPDEEATILASFDPIGDLATQDDDKLRPLLEQMRDTHSAVHQLLTEAKDFGGAFDDPATASDGSLLALSKVTIGEPQHDVRPGDIWRIGRHTLACLSVEFDWPTYSAYLADGAMLAPYPGVLAVLTRKATDYPLVMVQPDPYIAGHILDRSAEVYGGDTIKQLVKGDRVDAPTDDEIEPPYSGPRARKRPAADAGKAATRRTARAAA